MAPFRRADRHRPSAQHQRAVAARRAAERIRRQFETEHQSGLRVFR
jgi:hypothetical protein